MLSIAFLLALLAVGLLAVLIRNRVRSFERRYKSVQGDRTIRVSNLLGVDPADPATWSVRPAIREEQEGQDGAE